MKPRDLFAILWPAIDVDNELHNTEKMWAKRSAHRSILMGRGEKNVGKRNWAEIWLSRTNWIFERVREGKKGTKPEMSKCTVTQIRLRAQLTELAPQIHWLICKGRHTTPTAQWEKRSESNWLNTPQLSQESWIQFDLTFTWLRRTIGLPRESARNEFTAKNQVGKEGHHSPRELGSTVFIEVFL